MDFVFICVEVVVWILNIEVVFEFYVIVVEVVLNDFEV